MSAIETVAALLGTNLAAIIFAAGAIYNKVNNIQKQLDKMNGHSEDIAALKARLDIIQNSID